MHKSRNDNAGTSSRSIRHKDKIEAKDPSHSAMSVPLPPDWEEAVSRKNDRGRKYYYNTKTGLSQWDRPSSVEVERKCISCGEPGLDLVQASGYCNHCERVGGLKRVQTRAADTTTHLKQIWAEWTITPNKKFSPALKVDSSIEYTRDLGRAASALLKSNVRKIERKQFEFFMSSRHHGYKVDEFRVNERCLDREMIRIIDEEVLGNISSLEKDPYIQRKFIHYLLEKSEAMEYVYRVFWERYNVEELGREKKLEKLECIPTFVHRVANLWFKAIKVKSDTHTNKSFETTLFRHYFKGDETELEIKGFHFWLELYKQFKEGNITNLHCKKYPRRIFTGSFTLNGKLKEVSSIIIGLSPDVEISLLTLCGLFGKEETRVAFEGSYIYVRRHADKRDDTVLSLYVTEDKLL